MEYENITNGKPKKIIKLRKFRLKQSQSTFLEFGQFSKFIDVFGLYLIRVLIDVSNSELQFSCNFIIINYSKYLNYDFGVIIIKINTFFQLMNRKKNCYFSLILTLMLT